MMFELSLALTMRLTEVMLALALGQQALEHLLLGRDRALYAARLLCCLWLLTGWHAGLVLVVLWLSHLLVLHRFNGPYNGGADKMGVLITTCLMAAHLAPEPRWAELAISYLAVQLVLSYFVSGYVKIVNPDWRSGQALVDVYRFSAYPVAEDLRSFADHPKLLWTMSWCVMGFEVVFPLALLHPFALTTGMLIAGTFHLANAMLFGLNRFFWIWLCAYPSLIWFQDRVFG
ncbi:HTTM domain-containing protein [Cognatishimia sp. WU-CL00825]|uniref:HTTM domain-containing protein n=1 Tax=Cognatishimia sp. WU-CL00825 TaxID=3127658 RepID=UPI0031025249